MFMGRAPVRSLNCAANHSRDPIKAWQQITRGTDGRCAAGSERLGGSLSAMDTDWNLLVSQTRDLVSQDYQSFPRVERTLPQLHEYAENLRGRTSRFRSLSSQTAATRLLAQQGFDASRLTQEVTTLEVQPTFEDVFQADTSSVEDYLQQVEESTILAAIQEAQSETAAAFEAYMDDCMARDWAANKRQLFGLLAPHTGLSSSGHTSMLLSSGQQPLIGRSPAHAGSLSASASGGQRLSPKEQAYVDVVVQAHEASGSFDLIKEFTSACKANEDRIHENPMSGVWALLGEILSETHARSISASSSNRFIEAAVQGARKHLERGHASHTRTTISRHKLSAERGADPDPLREVQAFITVKFGSKGPLDFQQPGGLDTSWIQVYYALRNGYHDAARRAAEKAHDLALPRMGESGFKQLLEEWLRNNGRLSDRSALTLSRETERLLRDKASAKAQPKFPYMVLLCALLAGDNRAVDALSAQLTSQQLPAVLTTLEDFMWAKLLLVVTQPAPTAASSSPLMGSGSLSVGTPGGYSTGLPSYTLTDLHADINRWQPAYYSKNGKEPLLYVTVLLLSLQFGAALRFLWMDESTRSYRCDAVHLAIALFKERALPSPGSTAAGAADPTPDLGVMIHSWGQRLVHVNSALALHYYMLAAQVQGNSLVVKGQLLKELLTESRDFGTLLGGGGAGSRGALDSYVTDPAERRRLYEAVAYECQVAAQPEEAIELYLAAERPRQALAMLNQQISSLIGPAVDSAAGGSATPAGSRADEMLRRVEVKAAAAAERIGSLEVADEGSRAEVVAFEQLQVMKALLLAARKGRHETVLQRAATLTFLPLERSRVDSCIRMATQLHPAVQERLSDVLAASADSLGAQRTGAGREKLHALKGQLDALLSFANGVSYRINRALYQKLSETAALFA